MKYIFAPGCALMIYKPHLAEKIYSLLNEQIAPMNRLDICCQHYPSLAAGTQVINICPGCDRRYRNYNSAPGRATTISLWEVLAESSFFPFPDYHGQPMTILDACPTRTQTQVHQAIRTLLRRMNIQLIEPAKTGTNGTCCGDSFWGTISPDQVKTKMIERAGEMPLNHVVVYCVSCAKSIYIGGKTPHYLLDLLFAEETPPKTYEPNDWHHELEEFIEKH